ncbi:Hpt domain-containing protein [Cohnella sp. GCM10027633]|uniref:Hpt domain-containing protein n=1 Tax=unclassified Cohnella TaxID=2636738 RepID=UPI003641F278
MSNDYSSHDALSEMFINETTKLLMQLESSMLRFEKSKPDTADWINGSYRSVRAIKGSSAYMRLTGIASVAQAMEGLFDYMRERQQQSLEAGLPTDLIMEGIGYIEIELHKFRNGQETDGDPERLVRNIQRCLQRLQGDAQNGFETAARAAAVYVAAIRFAEDCRMADVRAFGIVHSLACIAGNVRHTPKELIGGKDADRRILANGFRVRFETDREYDELYDFLNNVACVSSVELKRVDLQVVGAMPAQDGDDSDSGR